MYGFKALPQASDEHRGRVVTKALFHLSEDRLYIIMSGCSCAHHESLAQGSVETVVSEDRV